MEGKLRIYFVLLAAFVIPVRAAFPQATNWTLLAQAGDPQKTAVAGSSQAWDAANPAVTEVLKLKQLASNGFAQGPAQATQQRTPQPFRPPQIAPWTGPFANIGPYGNGLDLGVRRQDLVGMLPNPPRACAIPLLEVPVDGSLDKGIRIPQGMRSGSSADPKMAVPPPAPACNDQPASRSQLKAK